MDEKTLRELLEAFRAGDAGLDDVIVRLKALPFRDLGFARLDTHRRLRTGFPEVIYAPGKSDEHLRGIIEDFRRQGVERFLVTRLEPSVHARLGSEAAGLRYFPEARILAGPAPDPDPAGGLVMVVSAGTADLPVAREAEITVRVMGSPVKSLHDVGVAGLHRLLGEVEDLQRATCLVVVAGMEGALPSVVAGVSGRPVIGVPTSVGYGASLGGLTPLLTMINSCAPNVAVVNIDNGFGAGFMAHLIARGVSVPAAGRIDGGGKR